MSGWKLAGCTFEKQVAPVQLRRFACSLLGARRGGTTAALREMSKSGMRQEYILSDLYRSGYVCIRFIRTGAFELRKYQHTPCLSRTPRQISYNLLAREPRYGCKNQGAVEPLSTHN